MNSKRLWVGGGILICLVLIRLWLIWALGHTLYARYPQVDAYTYWQQAESLWQGKDPFQEGLYQPPAYPYFIYALSHFFDGPSLTVMRWVQSGLGILTCIGLFLIGNRVGDRFHLYWVGCLAMLAYGLYPSVLLFEQDWLTPALSNVLVVFGVLGLIHKKTWSLALGAFSLGCAISVHPSLLLLGLVSLFWGWKDSHMRWPILLGLCLALSPTVVWNAKNGSPALVSHNGGINLYIGNGENWNNTVFLRPGLEFRQWVMQAEPAKRNVAERNIFWQEKTLEAVLSNPLNSAVAILTKTYWSFHNTEIPRNEDYRCRLDEPILQPLRWNPIRFGLIFPLGVLGILQCRKSVKESFAFHLPFFWLAAHLPLIIFFVSDRYRVATVPFLVILSAIGLLSLWKNAERLPIVLGVMIAMVVMGPIDSRVEKSEAWCAHVQGNLAFMEQKWLIAKAEYAKSLRLNPNNLSAQLYLGSIAERDGDFVSAKKSYELVLDGYPDHNPTLMALAKVCERQKDWSCATEMLERAYRVPGKRLKTGLRLFRLLLKLGQNEAAIKFVQAEAELWEHPEIKQWRNQSGD